MRTRLFAALIGIAFSSCKEPAEFEFDRTALLTEISENQIIPDYQDFVNKINSVLLSLDDFNVDPSEANFLDIRSNFSATYAAFQKIKMYEFGPAEEFGFRRSTNTYPTDSVQINANIASGTYTLGAVSNSAAIGLPAIDYLLNSGSTAAMYSAFTSGPSAANRLTYLNDLSIKIKTEATAILSAWNSGYKSSFIAANGTDISSSHSVLFNQFVIDLELVKNAKIGVPSGQYSGGEPFPSYVESYYNGASKSLAIANLVALKSVFTGGNGIGMDDYMDASVEFGSTAIPSSEITSQFDVCIAQIEALNDPFSESIAVDASGYSAAYLELKKLVAYVKTDIPAALGVLISFSDTDGD